jgi:hypothetical protein
MTAIAWWYFLSGHQWYEAWWCRPYTLVYRTGNISQGYIWVSCCPDVFWDSPVSTKAFSLSHACILHAKSFTTLWEAANCNILISQLVYKCTENCKACSTLVHNCDVPSTTGYIICSKNTIQYTDQEMIPARNARNVVMLADVMFVIIQRENILPSKITAHELLTTEWLKY